METAQSKVGVDEARVRDVLSRFSWPATIQEVLTSYGSDHSGDPAVFLTFVVKPGQELDRDHFNGLYDLLRKLTDALYSSDIGGFAYTRIRQAA